MQADGSIPKIALDRLRLLGGTPDDQHVKMLLGELRPFDWITRMHWESWYAAIADESKEGLKSIIQGLVRAEQIPRWGGGSVDGVIWVFKKFAERFPERAEEVADWVLRESNNNYAPFGTSRGSARSTGDIRG
jgi:hypothetical protein